MKDDKINIEDLHRENERLKQELNHAKFYGTQDFYGNIGIAVGEFDIEQLMQKIINLTNNNIDFEAYLKDPENFQSIISSSKPVRFNKEAVNLFEANDEEALINNFSKLVLKENKEDLKKIEDGCYHKKGFIEGETVFKTFKDRKIHVYHKIGFPNFDSLTVNIGFFDITQRKILENMLKASEERYKALFNNVPVMILEIDLSEVIKYFFSLELESIDQLRRELLDKNSVVLENVLEKTKIVDVNSTVVKILSAPTKEDVIENFYNYLPESGHIMFINNLLHAFKDDVKSQQETQLLTAKNELLDVFITWEIDSRHTDDISKLLVSMIDITKQKEIEREQNKFNDQLRQFQKLDSLGLLAGGLAHDFNNLLVPLLGNISLAQTYTEENTPLHKHLKDIEDTIAQASELTKQLLTYSGKGKFFVEICNLNEIIRKITYIIRLSATKRVKIVYDLAEALPNIEADVTQIQQVILNLVSNAAASMNNNGTIIIQTKQILLTKYELEKEFPKYTLPGGSYIRLDVIDEGEGIPDFIKDNIFDPFFSTKSGVRGLGLSVVMGIVLTHKGGITFKPNSEKGTTFSVVFPQNESKNIQNKPKIEVKQQTAKNLSGKILICDDEQSVREITSLMIQKVGLETFEAVDGKQCIEILMENKDIDLIILDLTMPEWDGEKTAREIRKTGFKKPILIVSGYNRLEIDLRFSELQEVNFLQKPYTYELLKEQLIKLLT